MDADNAPSCSPSPRPITPSLLKQLVHYYKYASSAYDLFCPRPNGNTLVLPFSNVVSDIQGFVARDDGRGELVVAFRGSMSMVDFLMDVQIVLVPLIAPGVTVPDGTRVHAGFLEGWNSVTVQVTAIIMEQLQLHPTYTLVATGHSLGGALATIGALALKEWFPGRTVEVYSYGAPRVGNEKFALFFNECFGENAHRVVHANDGVPTMIPTSLGYHHHGVEYWQKADPATGETTVQCCAEGEDSSCSASVPSGGLNAAHLKYFGIAASTPFCF